MAMLLRRFSYSCHLFNTLRPLNAVHRAHSHSDETPLKLSTSCISKLKEVAGPNESLRITVDSGGCSGFQYNFALDSTVTDDDVIIEEQGVRVVVDNVSLKFLEGAVIDYYSEMIKSSFRVTQNPKAEEGCSCGVSFSVKID